MVAREQLIAVLEDCVTRAQGGELTLGEVFDKLHESSFPLITIVMILPFLQPISLGPLATAGGLALTGLGWQMFRERETPWLPGRVRKISLNAKMWRILLRTCERVLSICKKITRPRLKNLAIGRGARKLGGFLIVFSGLLMAIPFAGLPFNNTLPALVMLFVAVGELEEDGFMVLLAVFFLVLTVAYFSFILWALLVMGDKAFDWLRDLLPSLLPRTLGAAVSYSRAAAGPVRWWRSAGHRVRAASAWAAGDPWLTRRSSLNGAVNGHQPLREGRIIEPGFDHAIVAHRVDEDGR